MNSLETTFGFVYEFFGEPVSEDATFGFVYEFFGEPVSEDATSRAELRRPRDAQP
jgi:hypothetical protein